MRRMDKNAQEIKTNTERKMRIAKATTPGSEEMTIYLHLSSIKMHIEPKLGSRPSSSLWPRTNPSCKPLVDLAVNNFRCTSISVHISFYNVEALNTHSSKRHDA
jgi:hypothetical protein